MYLKTFILWFDHFLDPWEEICQIFCLFFGKFKKSKRHSEIIWPLDKAVFCIDSEKVLKDDLNYEKAMFFNYGLRLFYQG